MSVYIANDSQLESPSDAQDDTMWISGDGRCCNGCARAAARGAGGRRILTLVYDTGLGMMRAVEKVVP